MQDGLEADLSNFSLGQPESRGESTCTQNEPACPPFTVSFKLQMKKEQTHSIHSVQTQRKRDNQGEGRRGETKMLPSDRQLRASHASVIHSQYSQQGCDYAGNVTELCAQV